MIVPGMIYFITIKIVGVTVYRLLQDMCALLQD